MKTSWLLVPALSLGLTLGGCAVVPERDYGYTDDERDYVRETVIMAPASHIEYRAYPPAANTIWIDGYWNRIGRQQVWVPGYWAPPGTRPRAIVQHRQFERHRDDDRRERWWGDSRRDRDGDRRRADGRRDQRADDQRGNRVKPRETGQITDDADRNDYRRRGV